MPQNDEYTKTEEGNDSQKKEIHKDDDIVEEVKEPQIEHLRTKPIPALVTLIAGSVVAVDTFFQGYSLKNALIVILASMIIFFLLGELIKLLLDRVEIIIPEEEAPLEEEAEAEEAAEEE